jgi:hypothetical protein
MRQMHLLQEPTYLRQTPTPRTEPSHRKNFGKTSPGSLQLATKCVRVKYAGYGFADTASPRKMS